MVVFAELFEIFLAVVDFVEAVFKRSLHSEKGIFFIYKNIFHDLCYYILLFILRQHLLYLSKRLCLYINVCLPFISNKLSILQLIAMLFISWQSEHLTDSYLLMGKYMFLLTVDKFSWISILLLLFPLELQLVNSNALHIWRHYFGNHSVGSKTWPKEQK